MYKRDKLENTDQGRDENKLDVCGLYKNESEQFPEPERRSLMDRKRFDKTDTFFFLNMTILKLKLV